MRVSSKRPTGGKLAGPGPNSPRPVTASYLRKAAMHYISGRAASAEMVRQTLQRRAKRRLEARILEAQTIELIDAAIAELLKLGLLDDLKFAENRTVTLVRKGLSRGRIALGLRAKGIPKATVELAIGNDIDELAQARRYVERRRLGSLRRGGMTPETRKKDLAALARAGFGFQVAIRALAQSESE